jgi:outer membrane protein assembly factor BamB
MGTRACPSRLAPALLVAWILAACAHASPLVPAARVDVPSFPAGAARVRHVGTFPSSVAAPRPSAWRRVLDAILGESSGSAAAPIAIERPFGVAVSQGAAVVTDPDRAAVHRIDWRRGTAAPVTCSGSPWTSPLAVAAAPDGTLFVADGGRVVRVDAAGCTEIGAGALERATGVAVANGRLYVVDAPRHVVIAFDAGGREALRFGALGDGEEDLNYPTAIAAEPGGTLLVVDALHFRVARFSADGRFLGAFGHAGDVVGEFGRPKAIAVDPAGGIYVTDAEHDAVVAFAPGGEFRFALGESGGGEGQMVLPAGVAADGPLLLVADSYNHRVQVYELLGDAP